MTSAGIQVSFLPQDALDQYREAGYLVVPELFSRAELADISASLTAMVDDLQVRFQAQARRRGSYAMQYEPSIGTTLKWSQDGKLIGLEPFCHLSDGLGDLGADQRLEQLSCALLGAESVCAYTEKVNLKPARIGEEITLHQDCPYWEDCCVNALEVLTVMLFLDDSTRANGCLNVVPGSHHRGIWPGRPDAADSMGACELDVSGFDWSSLVPLEVAAGSVVAFGSLLVHGSAHNASDTDRRALLYSYQPAGRGRLTDLLDPSWYS